MGRPHWWLPLAVLSLFWIQTCLAKDIPCLMNTLGQCPPDETCDQIDVDDRRNGRCLCASGKPRGPDGSCSASSAAVPSTTMPPPPSSSASAWGWLVAGLVAAVIVASLMLAARRFHWLAKLRARRQRNYDEVAFGQEDDDPPLA